MSEINGFLFGKTEAEVLRESLTKTEAMWREERAKVRELEMRLLDIKRMAER